MLQVEKLQMELEKQRGRNAQLEKQQLNGAAQALPREQQQPPPPPQQQQSGGAPPVAAKQPEKQGRRRGYSFWQWIAGADVAEAEAEE
jgi:hypothetical protein